MGGTKVVLNQHKQGASRYIWGVPVVGHVTWYSGSHFAQQSKSHRSSIAVTRFRILYTEDIS